MSLKHTQNQCEKSTIRDSQQKEFFFLMEQELNGGMLILYQAPEFKSWIHFLFPTSVHLERQKVGAEVLESLPL